MISEKNNLRYVSFALFVVVYSVFLMWNPHFGFKNYDVLKEAILASEDKFPTAIYPEIGRFYPLFAKEFNLIMLLSSSMVWLYVFNAIQYLLFIFLLYNLIAKVSSGKKWIFTSIIILSVMPGFTNSWFSFAATERNVIFYLAVFLLCYKIFLEKQKFLFLFLGSIAANIALYYKELGFIVLFIFALIHLIFSWKKSNLRMKLFDYLLIISSLIFAIVYYFLVFIKRGQYLYGETLNSFFIALFKNLFSYLLNDPIIVLMLLPLALWRFTRITVFREKPEPFYDAMLFAGSCYPLIFLKLNMYAPNYLLPAYVFALPCIVKFQNSDKANESKLWKTLVVASCFLIFTNAIPLGLHIVSSQKYSPVNEILAMDNLAENIRQRDKNGRYNIFLDGVYPDITAHSNTFTYDRDAYFNIGESLKRRGVALSQFDLKSTLPPKNHLLLNKYGSSNFSVFNSAEMSSVNKGDYLIIVPNTTKNISPIYIKELEKEYEIVYRTPSGRLFIPNFTFKTFIKFLVIHSGYEKQSKKIMADQNLLRWPDYYIFVKK